MGHALICRRGGGGAKLPAGTFAIYKIYTENDTFIAPVSGKFRITVIGPGGKSGNGSLNKGGGGSGAGGAARSILEMEKGTAYVVTVSSSITSFGDLVSATVGGNGEYGDNGAAGGIGGTASGGTEWNERGGDGTTSTSKYGGNGGFYAREDPFLANTSSGAEGGFNTYFGIVAYKPTQSGFLPYGLGSSGGTISIAGDRAGRGVEGQSGAVIVELVLE